MNRIEIELGDGRKLVAYPYSETSKFKEVWIDVESADGDTTPIAVIGCQAGLPIREFTARLWASRDGEEYDKEIHIESMEEPESTEEET
jgi:hypothetical protein